jgi:hypothetical protein
MRVGDVGEVSAVGAEDEDVEVLNRMLKAMKGHRASQAKTGPQP